MYFHKIHSMKAAFSVVDRQTDRHYGFPCCYSLYERIKSVALTEMILTLEGSVRDLISAGLVLLSLSTIVRTVKGDILMLPYCKW